MVNSPQWEYGKCQNPMMLFSYLQQILSHFLLNVITGSKEGGPHQYLLRFSPSHTLHAFVPPPIPFLHILFFPHLCQKLHPSLCIIISPYFSSFYLPLPLLHLHPPSPFLYFILIIFLSVSLYLITFVLIFIFIFISIHFVFHFLFLFLFLFHSFHGLILLT